MKNLIIILLSVVAIFASAMLTRNAGNKTDKSLISANNPSALVASGPHR